MRTRHCLLTFKTFYFNGEIKLDLCTCCTLNSRVNAQVSRDVKWKYFSGNSEHNIRKIIN